MRYDKQTNSIEDIKPGHHICCIYSTEEEHKALLTPFLRQGLEHNEKVIYIVDRRTSTTVLGYLKDDGLDYHRYVEKGQLQVLSANDAYMKGGLFDPDSMISLLSRATESALSEGYAALRVTGEMSWALKGLPGSQRLIEYEAKLNDFFPSSKCLAICQYDRREFDPALLLDVLDTHPIAVSGTEMFDNFYYMQPEDLLGPDPNAARLSNRLRNLLNHKQTEEALRQSEETARALLNTPTDVAALVDDQGVILDANEAMAQRFGRQVDELVGVNGWDLVPADVAKHRRSFFDQALKSGKSVHFEDERQGTWFDNVFYPVLDSQGKVTRVALLAHDITERRQMEDALRKSEARLRTAIESLPFDFFLMDENGRYAMQNSTCRQRWGDLIGKRLEDVAVDEDVLALWKSNNRKAFAGEVVKGEVTLKTGQEEGFYYNIISPVRTNGKILGILGVSIDITKHKRAAQALKAEKEFTDTALNALKDTFFVFEPSTGKAYRWNKAFSKISGYSDEEIRSMKAPDSYYDEDDLKKAAAATQKALTEGTVVVEIALIAKNGESIPTEYTGSVLNDNEGNPKYIIAVGRDITERKQAEEELRIRNQILDIFLTIPDEQMYAELLNVVLSALRSEYGTFGYFNEDGSFTVPAITREIYWEKCNVPDKEIIFQRGTFSGIWNRAIKEKKTLCSNKGPFNTPDGHIPIKNTMVTPIYYRDKLLSAIHVANKSTDYDEQDKALLETIADHIAPVLYARLERQKEEKDRKEAEEALRKARDELEERVRQRTAELTNAHEKLLQEIDERRRLERDILAISEREQRRIGQELHDSLGQQLTGTAIMIKALEQRLKAKSPQESARAQEIGRLLNQAAEQTRRLAKGLHPVSLDTAGLMSALQELAVNTQQLFGVHCTFDCDEPVPINDAAVAVHLYRIAQEAVTNAIKHGRAENIAMSLIPKRNMPILTVKSDGLDFPEAPVKNKGMGLQIMSYRAEMIGAALDVRRATKGGTIVTCAFPD